MPKSSQDKSLTKMIPFEAVFKDTAVSTKLNGWAKREKAGQWIDYSAPMFAEKAGTGFDYPKNSRISGMKGWTPCFSPEMVEKLYRDVIRPYVKNPDYLEWENKFMEYRYSPRSVSLPYDLVYGRAIEPYFTNAQQRVSTNAKAALEKGLSMWEKILDSQIPSGSLSILSLQKAMEELPATTNWGAPFFLPGKEMQTSDNKKLNSPQVQEYNVMSDNSHKYLKIAEYMSALKEIPESISLENAFWSIWSGQESSDYKDKLRGIVMPKQSSPWAEGHAWTMIGNSMKPFLDKSANFPMRAALVNQATVDKTIANMWSTLQKNDWVVSWDGSAYDTHMIPDLGIAMGQIMVDSFKVEGDVRSSLMNYFEHVFHDPLMTPDGVKLGIHGMPSGTTFTNELDSCYNEVLAYAFEYLDVAQAKGMSLMPVTTQGDDLVLMFSSHSPCTAEEVKEILAKGYEKLLMEVNPNKQMMSSTKCDYLKSLHIKGITESYSSYIWTFIGMLNMEHAKDWKWPMYSASWMMQAANHYANLEGFNQFMEFISKGDKELHLGVGLKGGAMSILQMAGGTEKVIKSLGYTQYTTHLGVNVSKGEAKVLPDLSSVLWVDRHSK
uniref:RdRp n=1 Tax=Limbe picobirna-like virus TaxID=2169478 RepID=A0A2Z4EVF3_9VIRU|nr:RdRp [Limbe picobirna-like virus]